MVIDTSAIVAVLFGEADAARFETAMVHADRCLISAATRVELSCVVEGRKGNAGRADLDAFLKLLAPEIVALTDIQADIAVDAFRRFGKGRHKAGLNIGDCFAYALARHAGEPLLFKGSDFGLTDIVSALAN
jgi:ribonuclease VapC